MPYMSFMKQDIFKRHIKKALNNFYLQTANTLLGRPTHQLVNANI